MRAGRQQLRPTTGRGAFGKVAERTAYESEELPAYEQREHCGVDQGLGHCVVAARDLIHSVAGLELLEDQLDLPPCAVGVSDLLGREHLAGNVRHVAVILVRVLVEYGDEAESLSIARALSCVLAVLERRFDLDVEYLTLKTTEDVLELSSLERDRVSSNSTMSLDDRRARVLLQARQEVALLRLMQLKS